MFGVAWTRGITKFQNGGGLDRVHVFGCGFQGCICTGWWEGKICWGHLGGVIAGSMKLIGLQEDVKLVINNIIYY